jgi:AcrR family transcriptional regulator
MRIERAAAEVFAERGFETANFDDIAERLDLRGSSLFHYFSSKRELFSRILQNSATQVLARLRVVVDAGGAPGEVWKRLVREQIVLQVRDFPDFAPLFFKTNTTDAELKDEVLALRREHARIFEEVADAWQREHDADATLTRIRTEVAFGAMAYLVEWYRPDGPVKVEQLADMLAEELALDRGAWTAK